MEYELPSKQTSNDGQYPAQDLQDVPPKARVLVEEEGEAVAHHNHMGLGLTVRNGILGKDQEVEEGDEVRHDESGPWMLEIVAKAGI